MNYQEVHNYLSIHGLHEPLLSEYAREVITRADGDYMQIGNYIIGFTRIENVTTMDTNRLIATCIRLCVEDARKSEV